ncbi:hypothetical protein MF406_05775 [Georgenia sp. TF02-10]|nr:DUF6541 family protein [Georgenia sp. TF02-10]UNX55745.1 hypothetical protein MF406_05775 [Georgenia sp. TF02-10]
MPTALALVVVLYGPGYLVLRQARRAGVLAWAAAPAVVVAMLAVGAVLLSVLGIAWAPGSVLVLLVLVVAGAAALGRLRRADPVALPPLSRWHAVLAGAGLAFGAGWQGWAFLRGMGAPDALQQIFDPVFHLNAAQTILRTGDASSFGGLDPMYGSATGVFYPAVWHSLVALVAPLRLGGGRHQRAHAAHRAAALAARPGRAEPRGPPGTSAGGGDRAGRGGLLPHLPGQPPRPAGHVPLLPRPRPGARRRGGRGGCRAAARCRQPAGDDGGPGAVDGGGPGAGGERGVGGRRCVAGHGGLGEAGGRAGRRRGWAVSPPGTPGAR